MYETGATLRQLNNQDSIEDTDHPEKGGAHKKRYMCYLVQTTAIIIMVGGLLLGKLFGLFSLSS